MDNNDTVAANNLLPQTPKVILMHDSMCGKINNTLLSKEMVSVEKVWAPTLPDVLNTIENMVDNVDAIAIHSMTNDLKERNVDEITDLAEQVIEHALQKANKVVITTIVNRDDDPLLNSKASAVNGNIKFKFINKPNVFLCVNDNLSDTKFRADKIHLTDPGPSRLANNIKYKVAEALDISVKKKAKFDSRQYNPNRRVLEEERYGFNYHNQR